MIRNKPTKPENRTSQPVLVVLFGMGFLAYVWLVLRQASVFGFVDEKGATVDRFTDLLLMPIRAAGIFSEGGPPSQALDRLPILLAVGIWFGISYWIGNPFIRLGLGKLHWLESRLLSILVGQALLSTATLGVGLAGGLSTRIPLMATICFLMLLAWYLQIKLVHPNERVVELDENEASVNVLAPRNLGAIWLTRMIPVLTCSLAIFYMLGSCMPPWEFDVLEYHLQAPKEFLQNGRIQFNDHNVYANMPLGAEMHSLAGMVLVGGERGWWWGGLFGKTVIGLQSVLGAALLGCFVAQKFGTPVGWGCAGLCLASPGNAHVAMAGLIDMVVGAYLTAMIITLSRAWQDLRTGQGRGATIFLASLYAGAAGACKYPGILYAVIPLLALLLYWLFRSRQPKQAMRWAMYFSLGLSVTCLPWLIKNAIETGNPVYPLVSNLFDASGLTASQLEQWQHAHSLPTDVDGSHFSIAAFFRSANQLLLASPYLNPSLVFLALSGLVALGWQRKLHSWALLWLSWLVWILLVWWIATHRIDRFWLPTLSLVAVLAAVGVGRMATRVSSTLTSGILVVGLSYGLLQIVAGAGPTDNRFFVALDTLEQESLDERWSIAVDPVTAWVNHYLGPKDKVLLIGEAQVYLYRVPILYATCFNAPPGESWLLGKTKSEQMASLKAAGVTHLLLDWAEIERYRSPGNYGFSDWPLHTDIDTMVDSGLLTRLPSPFDPLRTEILKVNADTH